MNLGDGCGDDATESRVTKEDRTVYNIPASVAPVSNLNLDLQKFGNNLLRRLSLASWHHCSHLVVAAQRDLIRMWCRLGG